MSCSYCSNNLHPTIETYKHTWHVCQSCGTVIRQKKEKNPYENALTRTLIRSTPLKKIYGNTLIKDQDKSSDTDTYTYYKEKVKQGVEGTKWENYMRFTLENFQRLGIDLKGKRVLDISGGPGFLAQAMKNKGADVVITEFAEIAAQGMQDALGIDSRKFDYNTDRIHEVVDGKFDIILCIYSINYCNDIKSFVQDLRKISKAGTQIYLVYLLPTLGLYLRWQYDEYTYSTLHSEKTTQEAFEKAGFRLTHEKREEGYHYTEGWFEPGNNPVLNLLMGVHRKIASKYRKKAEKQLAGSSLEQIGVVQVFEVEA